MHAEPTGIYVAVHATDKTKYRLAHLLAEFSRSVPTLLPSDIHVTLAYDAEAHIKPYALSSYADPMREFEVTVLLVELWIDPKGRPLIVARLESHELDERHALWKSLGLHWSFPSFLPHFSITQPMTPDLNRGMLQRAVSLLNDYLQGKTFTFSYEYPNYANDGTTVTPLDEAVDHIMEIAAARRGGAMGKGSGKRARPSSMPGIVRPSTHRPELTEEEEKSITKYGFNVHGIRHRIHDDHPIEEELDPESSN